MFRKLINWFKSLYPFKMDNQQNKKTANHPVKPAIGFLSISDPIKIPPSSRITATRNTANANANVTSNSKSTNTAGSKPAPKEYIFPFEQHLNKVDYEKKLINEKNERTVYTKNAIESASIQKKASQNNYNERPFCACAHYLPYINKKTKAPADQKTIPTYNAENHRTAGYTKTNSFKIK